MTEVVLINPATALSLLRLASYISDYKARGFVDPQVSRWFKPKRRALLAPMQRNCAQAIDGDVQTNIHLGFWGDVESD